MPTLSPLLKCLLGVGLVAISLSAPVLASGALLTQAQLNQLVTYRQQYGAVKNQAQLLTVYRQSHKLSTQLNKAVEKPIETRLTSNTMPSENELLNLAKLTPGLFPALVAEATMLVFLADYEAYGKLAAKTPEKADDAFFALMKKAYGDIYDSYGGWFTRTWDYGGCTNLGSGLHLQLLQGIQSQRKAKSPFGPELKELEEHVLGDINQGNNFCKPHVQVIQEVQQIIKVVPAAHQPKLQQRLKQLQKPTKEMGFDCDKNSSNCHYG